MDSLNALYIHWPFCVSKCPYCDFNSHVRATIDEDLWERCLLEELIVTAHSTPIKPLTSIFFGGGTPSLMPPKIVQRLLEKAQELFSFSPQIEISLEANPGTYDKNRFEEFAQAGVNRLSLGIQSFKDTQLKFLGRIHSSQDCRDSLIHAKNLFSRVSFDLIYALPHQSSSEWEKELYEALSFDPTHLSLYQLTFEEGTPFTQRKNRGHLTPLPDEEALSLYLKTQEIMENHGLFRYEISNHALSGHESLHNLTYWTYGTYYGIGPGAHGRCFLNNQKVSTQCLKNPEKWIAQVLEKSHGWDDVTPLGSQTRFEEALMMGLRLTVGLSWSHLNAINEQLTKTLKSSGYFSILQDEGFLTHNEERLWLTPKGLLTHWACVRFLINNIF